MIDRFIYKFLGLLDNLSAWIDFFFFSKPKKRKKRKCKNCNCKCHCKEILHSHFYDGELCTCEVCKC